MNFVEQSCHWPVFLVNLVAKLIRDTLYNVLSYNFNRAKFPASIGEVEQRVGLECEAECMFFRS